ERFPAVIPIPGIQGSLGIGMLGVKRCVEKAVGADILFRDE
ncbi:MAG: V-type ATP synthase subunit F, partial [Ruminiclostridium sp.]|nr:V-type ATP synthase subunit F [Ruminiclostridium sp.]